MNKFEQRNTNYLDESIQNKKDGIKITIPKESQIIGPTKLDFIRKYGSKAPATDFALLNGAQTWPAYIYNTADSKGVAFERTVDGKATAYWTRTRKYSLQKCYKDHIMVIATDGKSFPYTQGLPLYGARPMADFSEIRKDVYQEEIKDGIDCITYGEYPQNIMDIKDQVEAERLFHRFELRQTGKTYTMPDDKLIEYEYKGHKVVRVVPKESGSAYIYYPTRNYGHLGYDNILSNGQTISKGKPYWVEVKPIIWFVDKDKTKALSKYVLTCPLTYDSSYERVSFEESELSHYLNAYFSKDIIPSIFSPDVIEDLNQPQDRIDSYEIHDQSFYDPQLESNRRVELHRESFLDDVYRLKGKKLKKLRKRKI